MSNVAARDLGLVLMGPTYGALPRLLDHAAAVGMRDRVHHLGFLPANLVPALYRRASALVFPTLYEGFGLPAIEAMACGCPVAAARSGPLPEICGDAALMFDPTDLEECVTPSTVWSATKRFVCASCAPGKKGRRIHLGGRGGAACASVRTSGKVVFMTDAGLPVRVAHLAGSAVPYKIPIYRILARDPRIDFEAVFCSSGGLRPFDDGYGREITWDSDLTSGYKHTFLQKADQSPVLGSRFWSVRDLSVIKTLVSGKFDVLWIEGYNSLTYTVAALTQWCLGRRVVIREEQTLLHPRPLAKTVAKEVLLRLLFRHVVALYISRENQRWFEHYGVPERRRISAPYTVDNDAFQADAARLRNSRNELRRGFGIADDGGPVIVAVSRLIPKKQPLFLLEAFRRVRAKTQCTLVIVGSGPQESAMAEKVQSEAIPDVIMAGFVNQSRIGEAYAVADIFTLLSREAETFGVVVAEAMNFALPIVVSDKVGCGPDLVSNDFNGYVVSATSPDAAADALGELVDDPVRRRRMGAASLERISGWDNARTVGGIIAGVSEAVGRERWASAGPQ